MTIPGNLNTTAMAVMPHKDAGRALEFALSMDIPFWPQLPPHNKQRSHVRPIRVSDAPIPTAASK